MADVMIWSPIDRILWGMAILLSLICAISYLNQGKKNDNLDERLISFGYSFDFFIATISIILLLLSELQIPGEYVNHTFYGNYDEASSLYEILVKYGWILSCSQFILFFYAFERFVKKTYYLITISNLICVVLLLVLPFNLEGFLVLALFYMLIFFIILLLYTKWSRLELKAVSALILLGAILITVGTGFSLPTSEELNIIPLIIAPLFSIFGSVFILLPTIINSGYFTSGSKYWKIIGAVVIGLLCFVEFFVILYSDLFYFIINSVLLLFVIFSLFYTLKYIKLEISLEKRKEPVDILRAFTRPKKVTEEEIMVSKEKRICVVCKGKLERNMYICPDCNTFYCNKCSDSLADLENACWVCDTPFDKSKPVTPFKKEREKEKAEIEVSEKPPKMLEKSRKPTQRKKKD